MSPNIRNYGCAASFFFCCVYFSCKFMMCMIIMSYLCVKSTEVSLPMYGKVFFIYLAVFIVCLYTQLQLGVWLQCSLIYVKNQVQYLVEYSFAYLSPISFGSFLMQSFLGPAPHLYSYLVSNASNSLAVGIYGAFYYMLPCDIMINHSSTAISFIRYCFIIYRDSNRMLVQFLMDPPALIFAVEDKTD